MNFRQIAEQNRKLLMGSSSLINESNIQYLKEMRAPIWWEILKKLYTPVKPIKGIGPAHGGSTYQQWWLDNFLGRNFEDWQVRLYQQGGLRLGMHWRKVDGRWGWQTEMGEFVPQSGFGSNTAFDVWANQWAPDATGLFVRPDGAVLLNFPPGGWHYVVPGSVPPRTVPLGPNWNPGDPLPDTLNHDPANGFPFGLNGNNTNNGLPDGKPVPTGLQITPQTHPINPNNPTPPPAKPNTTTPNVQGQEDSDFVGPMWDPDWNPGDQAVSGMGNFGLGDEDPYYG